VTAFVASFHQPNRTHSLFHFHFFGLPSSLRILLAIVQRIPPHLSPLHTPNLKMKVQLLLGALLPLASAHFKLIYPAARGFDEDLLVQFPCGGQNTVSSNRTQFPITGAPIQLLMGHTEANVQVLMALGNDPGINYDITLVPTFQEQGPENFCMGAGAIQFPAGLNITDGMNATIQVVTNGDPNGGLYNVRNLSSGRGV
jgi:hypothetical protein